MDFGGPSNEGFSARRSYGPPGGGSNISFGGPVPVGQSYVDKPASSSNPYAATYNKQNEPNVSTVRSHGSPQSYRARHEPQNNGIFLEHQPRQYQQPPQNYREQPPSQQYQQPPQSYREQPPSQQYQQPPQSYREQPPSQQYQQPPQSYRDQPPSQQYQQPPQSYREQPPSQQYHHPPNQNANFDVHSKTSTNHQTGRGNNGGDHQPTGTGSKPSLFLATGRPGQSTGGEKPSGQVTRRDMVWEQKRQKFLEKQRIKKEQSARQGQAPRGDERGTYDNRSQQSPSQYQDPEYMSHSARVQEVSPPSPLSMLVKASSQNENDGSGGGYQQPPQQYQQQGYQNQAQQQQYQQPPQGYQNQAQQQQYPQPPQGYQNQAQQQYQQPPQGYQNQAQQQQYQQPPQGYQNQAPQQQYQQPPQGYQNQQQQFQAQQQYSQPPQSVRQGDRPGSGRQATTGSAIAYGYNEPNSSNAAQPTARRGRGAGGGSSQISFG